MVGYRMVALTVSSAVFMQLLDSTALNTALPSIAHDFDVPAVSLNVAILAYQLALAALIPLGTIIADRVGARNAFAASLLLFFAGSLLCASSTSLPALVASRTVQGLGGAVMIPVSRLLVVRTAAKHELVSALNWLFIPGIIGPLLGPTVGGLIVTYSSWHWIFLINLPIAIIGIVLTLAVIPEDGVRVSARVDILGVLLIAATITCFIFGLEGLARPSAGLLPVALVIAALAMGYAYVRHAKTHPQAALDLSLMKIDSFRHSLIGCTVMRTISGATGFILPLWFQLAMGMSPAEAGVVVVAGTTGALLSRLFGSKLIQWVHPRRIAMTAAILAVPLLLLTAGLQPGLPRPLFALILFAQGLSMAVTLMIISASVYVDVPPERMASGAGVFTLAQQLTPSLGVTAGVWAIGAMGAFTHSGPNDAVTYSGSVVIFAALQVLGIYAVAKISRDALGELRQKSAAG